MRIIIGFILGLGGCFSFWRVSDGVERTKARATAWLQGLKPVCC